jgi:kynurenine formamidase
MLINIEWNKKNFSVDLNKPIDISIPLRSGENNPNAFGIQQPLIEPFKFGDIVLSVAKGGSVNCENLFINPHGNGTHTECVGHISKEKITINQTLTTFFSIAQLITVEAENNIITKKAVQKLLNESAAPIAIGAIVIRTLPNGDDKLTKKYSGNTPTFLEAELCNWLREKNIKHLLIDLPSVDAEEDGGELAAHHAFWNYPAQPRMDATITEMIFVDDKINDGIYLLNIQIASIESDASPSKPVLYELKMRVEN